MTATDELHRLLDERGVEYKDRNVFGKHVFHWGKPFHGAMFTDAGEWTELVVENATPEQAIEATLGRGTCRRQPHIKMTIGDDFLKQSGWDCSECGYRLDFPASIKYCPNCGRKVVDA